MKRPIYVRQNESDDGQFWYTVDRGAASTMLTSETYPTRSNAIRAARGYIAAIDPVPVVFTYWVGLLPATLQQWHSPSPTARLQVTERVR